jgi:hypothetical protein
MKSVHSDGSLSLLFVMKVMVCSQLEHFSEGYNCTYCHVTFQIAVEVPLQFHIYVSTRLIP